MKFVVVNAGIGASIPGLTAYKPPPIPREEARPLWQATSGLTLPLVQIPVCVSKTAVFHCLNAGSLSRFLAAGIEAFRKQMLTIWPVELRRWLHTFAG